MAVGTTSGQALQNTTDLARRTEELGYRRFWVAEHHNMPAIASSAPAVLIAHLAAATSTIRVGSGGVMLPNHAPLVVAEQFGTLEALHPGRIDLGIGRAPGTDQSTALALRRTMEGLSAEGFPQELAELIGYFLGNPQMRITAAPGKHDMPDIWLLGSSGFSAQLAGLLGLPFAFAHHFSAANTVPALELYRESFQPSRWLDALCADRGERGLRGHRGGPVAGRSGGAVVAADAHRASGPLATPEEAAAYQYGPDEREFAIDRFASQAVGSPETVRAKLTDLVQRTGADELMLTAMVYDINDRIRSFELITEKVAGDLPAPAA